VTPVPGLDRLARRLVIAHSRRIFAHGPGAAKALCQRFPSARGKVATITLGNWIDYYPHGQRRQEARAALDIAPDTYVYLFIGLCKEYKNVHGFRETLTSGASRKVWTSSVRRFARARKRAAPARASRSRAVPPPLNTTQWHETA
jgi:hypothetical protein